MLKFLAFLLGLKLCWSAQSHILEEAIFDTTHDMKITCEGLGLTVCVWFKFTWIEPFN